MELIRQGLLLVSCMWANGVLSADPPTSLPNGAYIESATLGAIDVNGDSNQDIRYVVSAGWFTETTYANFYGVETLAGCRILSNGAGGFVMAANQRIDSRRADWVDPRGGDDQNAAILLFVKYVAPWTEESLDVARDVSTCNLSFLTGIRFPSEDGPHFGWLRFERPDLAPGRPYRLVDYAVNPTPNASILAGVHPPPPAIATTVRVEPGSDPVLEISWPTQLGSSAYHLEWTPSLTEPAWKPVEGVAGQAVAFSAGEGTAFFRLVRQSLP